jgi:hypothetical protein
MKKPGRFGRRMSEWLHCIIKAFYSDQNAVVFALPEEGRNLLLFVRDVVK